MELTHSCAATHGTSRPQLVRLGETGRAPVVFTLDGRLVEALEGDTVLTAVLTQSGSLRQNEFSGQPRAGFCAMGACQDCWIQCEDGRTLRSCSTVVQPGMRLVSRRAVGGGR